MSNKELIGIIGAMQVETEGLIAEMTDTKTDTVSGVTFTSGTLCGKNVVVGHMSVYRFDKPEDRNINAGAKDPIDAVVVHLHTERLSVIVRKLLGFGCAECGGAAALKSLVSDVCTVSADDKGIFRGFFAFFYEILASARVTRHGFYQPLDRAL